MDRLGRCQHLRGAGPHSDVLSKVGPAHRASAVYQKFRRTGNIMSVRAAFDVQQAVTPDCGRIRIREQSKGVTGFAREIQRNFRLVDADGNRTYTGLLELWKLLLYAS